MSYAIVGFGKIGQALAHAFARRNGQSYDEAKALLNSLDYFLYAMVEGMLVPISPAFPYGRDIVCVPSSLRASR